MMSHVDPRCAKNAPSDFKALWKNTIYTSVAASDDDTAVRGSMDEGMDRSAVVLNKFHAYACLYWPHHLVGSRDCQVSPPFKNIHQDFMVGEDGTVSRSFVYWNGLIWRSEHYRYTNVLPFAKVWRSEYGDKIYSTISDPAEYLFCANIWGLGDILELRIQSDLVGLSAGASRLYIEALHLACTYGNIKEAKVLLEAGSDWMRRL